MKHKTYHTAFRALGRGESGFTMVELIVTIAILVIGIYGIYAAFQPIIQLTDATAMKFTAAYLAQEGMEIARNIRDDNMIAGAAWDASLSGCTQGCQADYKTLTPAQQPPDQLAAYDPNAFLTRDADGFYGYASGTATPYLREITVTPITGDILQVAVTVSWSYNGKPYQYQTQEDLYHWY